MIDYSSSARDVPSSTPTAHCQTKRTPSFFPPLCFSRSRSHSSSLLPSHVVIDRGARSAHHVDGGRERTRFSLFAHPPTTGGRARRERRSRVIPRNSRSVKSKSLSPKRSRSTGRLQILFCPFINFASARGCRRECGNIRKARARARSEDSMPPLLALHRATRRISKFCPAEKFSRTTMKLTSAGGMTRIHTRALSLFFLFTPRY